MSVLGKRKRPMTRKASRRPKQFQRRSPAMRPGGFRRVSTRRAMELNYNDLSATATSGTITPAWDTTGSVTLVNTTSQGVSAFERLGNKTLIKSVQIRCRGQLGATPTDSCMRTMLVWDKQPNGAIATIASILQQSTGPVSQMLNMLNQDNKDRFVILMDKLNHVSTVGPSNFCWKKFKKTNLETVWDSTNGGAIGNIRSGALLIVTIGQLAAGATAPVGLIQTRIRYVQ